MALVPFINGKPARPPASYWDGCEIVTGDDGVVRIAGPHGVREYPAGTEFQEWVLPADWPAPVEPRPWDDDVTDADRAYWRTRAAALEVNGQTDADVAMAWICDESNDDENMRTWSGMADRAGLAWPGRGKKANRIAEVRTQAQCWGAA